MPGTDPPQSHDEFSPTNAENEVLEELAGEEQLEQEASASIWRENRQIIVLALTLSALVALVHLTPLREWTEDAQQWKRYLREFGWPAYVGYGLAAAAAVMMGVPRTIICLVSGGLFAFAAGMAVSWFGSTLGSYAAFLLARWGARRPDEAQLALRPWLRRLLSAPSVWRVAWVRQLPVPGLVLNLLLGVTAVKHRVFLLGTLLGYLPLNIAFTLVGSGLGKADLGRSLAQILGAIAVVNLVAWSVWKLVKKHRAQRILSR
jgi:uncharacterized membrane protein YdjX (TVP38/TMEM64 family)